MMDPVQLDHGYFSPTRQKGNESKSNVHCCVPLCNMWGYKDIPNHGRISYHIFPQDDSKVRKQWIVNIRRDEDKSFKINKHTKVCSLHFETNVTEFHQFSGRRKLLPGAVPTVFDCWRSKKLIFKEKKERPSNKLQQKTDLDAKSTNLKNEQSKCKSSVISQCTEYDEVNHDSKNLNDIETQSFAENYLLKEKIRQLEQKIEKMEATNLKLKSENDSLNSAFESITFCVENIKDNDFPFYTGFSNRAVFNEVLSILNPGQNGENIILNSNDQQLNIEDQQEEKGRRGRPRKLSPANQFFLFLCRVKAGLYEHDLANRFNVSVGTVSNVIITWSNFIYIRLGSLNIWPTKEQVKEHMPHSFKAKYPSTRVIIDCTEIKVEMPSSLLLKSQTYSHYKGTNTLKGLIGIAPCGSVSFVSQLYTGCISDREITSRSGLLSLPFDQGDSIMADKGFDIQDLLDDIGVKINIPPFLHMQGQMPSDDVFLTQSIAAERIHVERAINKIKNFHIFDQVLPLTLFGSINQIWTACALLTLFQDPIIS